MYKLYILKSLKGHIYVGVIHGSIKDRIERHKNGDGAEFTKRNRVYKFVYQEEYRTLIDARRRERQIKGWKREKKENLIKFGKPCL